MRVSIFTLLVVAVAMAGCHVPCQVSHKQNLPPAEMLMHPGPGVDGPGPGVMMYQPGIPTPQISSQMAFIGPEGMSVTWDVTAPGQFDSEPLICPARYNFPQGAIYQLKISNIPGRPGVELYPTLEVGPAMPRSEAFLAHNAIPIQFTEEDFDQVLSGNFVTKVIYLPDPEFQELAVAGVETLVSTRLDPGVDPIVEADRRGAILAVVRIGNKDLQLPAPADVQGGNVQQVGYSCPCPIECQRPGSRWTNAGRIGAHGHGRWRAEYHAQQQLYLRRDHAAVRHADVRHAHRTSRPAPRAAGSSCRIAKEYDCQSHARAPAQADRSGPHRRERKARLQLSKAGRSRADRGARRSAGRFVSPIAMRSP